MKQTKKNMPEEEPKMYVAPPSEKDIFAEKLSQKGYDTFFENGVLIIRCESRKRVNNPSLSWRACTFNHYTVAMQVWY